ncbi:hypothetical protein FSP39_000680 [Pinctada imbricata]|uniref:WASH complex subunit 3 n=1 Tax=Pinctada imbricata TaxID=66713 RepID=A0AA88Y6R9_PINIB|nr:hypothetical protein FSP39_000680 [Pinctada imbricata]
MRSDVTSQWKFSKLCDVWCLKVEAIQQKRTIAFLNHFINHTVRFLNRFSCVCEEKLEHMANRIQQLEITMNLLETKLSSIPGLENVTAPTSSQPDAGTGTQQPATQTPAAPQTATPQPQGAPAAAPQPAAEEPPPPPVEEAASNPVSKDPRYAKYFKMVQVGVPEHAVKLKMANEGLDASFLDTPDAPAPPMEETKKDSDSDDFDDSDDDASSMSD